MFRFIGACALYLLDVFFLSSLSPIHGQSFTEVHPGLLKPADLGYTSWCDMNNDGYPDLFLTGFNLIPNGSGDYIDFDYSIIYINDRNGSFRQSNITNIPRAIYGSSAWGDFNNDGWADLVMTGTVSGFNADDLSHLYINNRDESFTRSSIALPSISASQTIWFDYDNDGWQDLFMMGIDFSNKMVIKVMHNDKGQNLQDSEIVFDVKNGGAVNLAGHDAVIGDFDNDMDQDIILSQTSTGGFSTDVYENSGGTFIKKNTSLKQTSYATLAMADFNADGNLDVVINGIDRGEQGETFSGTAYFDVYRGDGKLNFTLIKTFPSDGSYWGSITAGDINNDGLPDIVVNGTGNGSARTTLFTNSGGNDFIRQNAGLKGTLIGQSTLCDYDNDGDLDIFVIGTTSGSASDAQAHLYRNNTIAKNNPPSIPGNVRLRFENNKAVISWDPSTDDTTPTKSLSYNITIGSRPYGSELFSGMSNINGTRQVDMHGNTTLALSHAVQTGTGTFYYQVQAIDAAYHESALSPPQLGCVIPPPIANYKQHYCHNEQVVIATSGEHIEIYEDAALSKLLHNGPVYSRPAISTSTLYIVERGEPGCISIPATIQYTVSDEPGIQFYHEGAPVTDNDVTLSKCSADQELTLEAKTNYPNISWSVPGGKGNTVQVRESQNIKITVTDDHGCSAMAEVETNVTNYADLFIPNVITPNGDGYNDFFVLNTPDGLNVAIINQFGSSVFKAKDYRDNFNGTGLSAGVYFYAIEMSGCSETKKGALHILH
jgi:hypothetical protein